MTPDELVNTVQSRMKTLVQDVLNIAGTFDNVEIDPPDGEPMFEAHVLLGERTLAQLGNPRTFRTTGSLMVNIYAPVGEGSASTGAIVNKIDEVFRGVTVDAVVYLVPQIQRLGRQGTRHVTNVSCPFRHDDTE